MGGTNQAASGSDTCKHNGDGYRFLFRLWFTNDDDDYAKCKDCIIRIRFCSCEIDKRVSGIPEREASTRRGSLEKAI